MYTLPVIVCVLFPRDITLPVGGAALPDYKSQTTHLLLWISKSEVGFLSFDANLKC